ncbi:S24 family peptidase [Pseudomonas sp. RP23018S]|uniref:LexA family protein n=1 Tax=Pseudomonas sp. RP23018S TaxID=3096037 RepID=UPI002ACA58C0|nr:S24 family peptidase [Pseudomonas sp. RP23018S]MDZ5605188.1 S24 family peptidase [Pseudomonas sp. RP23018S]
MIVTLLNQIQPSHQLVQVLSGAASGGFPSPAADYHEAAISLDELMNVRAPHVFLVRVQGDSMQDSGIFHGSRILVDRAIEPCPGHIVLAYVDNQPVVKRLINLPTGLALESANPAYGPIELTEDTSVEIFGTVTWIVTNAL